MNITAEYFWSEFWRLAPTVFFWCALPFVILNIVGIIWIKMTTEPSEKKKAKMKKTINWDR